MVVNYKKIVGVLVFVFSVFTFVLLYQNISYNILNKKEGMQNILFYYTIQSNILVAIWLFLLSIYILFKKTYFEFTTNKVLITSLTTYILVTGIIYWTILIPIFMKEFTDIHTFSNVWLHTVTPLVSFIIMVFINKNYDNKKNEYNILGFYIFPIYYICFGIIHAINGRFLYPFFNPVLFGWWGVAFSLVMILAVFSVVFLVMLRSHPCRIKYMRKLSI